MGHHLPDGEQQGGSAGAGDASLYPPTGKRSNGPIRAAMYGEASNYQKIANDEVLVIPMIETQEGIDKIDEILSVPGISGIYIGPSEWACRSA